MTSRHGMIMLLCCVIPLGAIFAVSVLGIPLDGLGTVALLLLCPLMHILMMKGMGGHNHAGQAGQPSCHETAPASEAPSKAK